MRRERPHPGAQLSFTEHDGHRFLATLTDLDGDAVELERLHRARASASASAEDRAQDLTAWTQHLALDGELARCEPKALRYRLLHTAGRLAFHARGDAATSRAAQS